MTAHYLTTVSIGVCPTTEELNFTIGAKHSAKLPNKVRTIITDLMTTIPIVVTKGWYQIIRLVPEADKGFTADLHFNFFLDEDNDWAVNGQVENKDGIEPVLMGMAKMIFTDDPVIKSLLEDDDEPEYIQHFDPTC